MNIFVGNIAFTASEDDLRELFEQHGTVDKVHLITDRYTGRSRGFGFVEMSNADEAKAAIETLNGAALHNRPLTVNEARPREPRRDGGRREY
jgi:RNA recognition motif-containing protein